MADDRQLEKSKTLVLINIINSLLKSGTNTANIKNINVKTKVKFIHNFNGADQKPQKIIKGNVNHTNISFFTFIPQMSVCRMYNSVSHNDVIKYKC